MAAVKSLLRKVVKPILFSILGENQYLWFQYLAKIKDIDKKLVEEDEMELLPLFIKEDSVSFDIGANYAYYTVRLARLSPAGRVYAFEPIPPTFKVASRIVKHYGLKNAVVFEKGVGQDNTTLKFEVPLQDSGFISGGQAHFVGRHNQTSGKEIYYPWDKNRTYECSVISIDREFSDLKRLDFIKMDIEGAEVYALKGMAETLKKLQPVILIEICKFWLSGFNITGREMSDFISGLGYEIYHYSKAKKVLTKVNSLENDENYNYIDKINLIPVAPNYFLIPRDQDRIPESIRKIISR
jgi:FkbM family methyltransferase